MVEGINRSLEQLAQPPPPRMRVQISDVAWGVFWGLFGWSLFAFVAFLVLSALLVAV
ncbi:MAG TPA: hypothetical protein VFV13_12815 [Acidimicrobiia bacterium]|nr:hypothetical protein [Acidimicrobiia bacterium]